MNSKMLSLAAVGVLMIASLSGGAAVKAHHQMFFGSHESQNADPISGDWNFIGYDHDNRLPAKFNLKLEGTIVTGTTYTDKTGEGIIRDGKWLNGKLSLVIDFKQHKSLVMEGTLKAGKLTGECHHPEGPMYKWEATRSDDPISGEWDVTFYVHEQKTPASFTFKVDGKTVTGTAYSDHTGPGTIRDGKYADGKLSFTLDFQKHESIIVNGALRDGKLSGEFTTEGFTDKWEATRK